MKQLLAATALIAFAACAPKTPAPKMLVLYYSQTGNTRAVAETIAQKTGADLEEIVACDPYDGDFQQTIERCLKEREEGYIPQVQPLAADLSAYDVVFLGYPVWFGTYAPPVAGMLETIDLGGKKVVPFCTFGSGGLFSSSSDLAAKFPTAEILPGYGVRAARMEAMSDEVDRWLITGGWIEGEAPVVEPFPEQHPVSDKEAAIFDAAVDGYPMLSATATAVASRSVPEGTEYLFTAVDKPREGGPDAGPAPKRDPDAGPGPKRGPVPDADAKRPPRPEPHPLQVYVLAAEGLPPVFTQVVR